MGFRRHHTLKLDRVLFKDAHWHESEDIRQSALGNSFHTTTVSVILGAVLEAMGFLKSSRSPEQLVGLLVVEDYEENYPDMSDQGKSDAESLAAPSLEALEDDDRLNQAEVLQTEVDDEEANKNTMAQLVHVFLRRGAQRVRHPCGYRWPLSCGCLPKVCHRPFEVGMASLSGIQMEADGAH